jgi:broad specificity phosphatase PhoE
MEEPSSRSISSLVSNVAATDKVDDDDDDDIVYVIVVRHGERLDYYMRDVEKKNWLIGQDRPWDPPLTEHGTKQAQTLGRHLSTQVLPELNIPPISAIYSSPFLRCRQTSQNIRQALLVHQQQQQQQQQLLSSDNEFLIRCEWGFSESLNDSWYRSWALPGSEGTWGYRINRSNEYDIKTIHMSGKVSVQESVIKMTENYTTDDDHNSIDTLYESLGPITKPYNFYTHLTETAPEQRERMTKTLEAIIATSSLRESTTTTGSTSRPSSRERTLVVVSHGGPVTHLFESLMNKNWHVHGEATYCCYSIYKKCSNKWEAICINQSKYLHDEKLESINYMDNN